MQYCVPRDVEAALAEDLAALNVHATPTPSKLGADLPYCTVERTGGNRTAQVVDTHAVSFDVWAGDWGAANDAAQELFARVAALPTTPGTSVAWLAATADAMPYNNPDPDRPDLPRVTFSARLTCKARIVNI